MQSEIKVLMSTDVFDLENYRPDDYKSFAFVLTLTVGIKGEIGGDNFDIYVCTPKWLLDNQSADIIPGKGMIIVFRCDMKIILMRIRALFEGVTGEDWNEIAIKLSRIGNWEFENYQS